MSDDMWPEPLINQQILEKAIQKAIEGGWQGDGMFPSSLILSDVQEADDNWDLPMYGSTIFNHDFAKALWPIDGYKMWHNKKTGEFTRLSPDAGSWQYHLMMMVVAEDPIKYLGEHIE